MNTLRSFLNGSGLPRSEAHSLVQYVLGVSRAWILAHDDEVILPEHWQLLERLSARREQGEPMAYLTGHREFMGLSFGTSPAVLIPRPDTEVLVEKALALSSRRDRPTVLDLGTGSGAIAIAIKHYAPHAQVIASDFSQQALHQAQRNAEYLKTEIGFVQSDWLSSIPPQKFDLIVSNPPYIHREDEHLNQGDLRFEPKHALTDFADGLSAIRNIISTAPAYLAEGGSLWLEHGWDQALAVRTLLRSAGFIKIASERDLAGIERISGGVYLK